MFKKLFRKLTETTEERLARLDMGIAQQLARGGKYNLNYEPGVKDTPYGELKDWALEIAGTGRENDLDQLRKILEVFKKFPIARSDMQPRHWDIDVLMQIEGAAYTAKSPSKSSLVFQILRDVIENREGATPQEKAEDYFYVGKHLHRKIGLVKNDPRLDTRGPIFSKVLEMAQEIEPISDRALVQFKVIEVSSFVNNLSDTGFGAKDIDLSLADMALTNLSQTVALMTREDMVSFLKRLNSSELRDTNTMAHHHMNDASPFHRAMMLYYIVIHGAFSALAMHGPLDSDKYVVKPFSPIKLNLASAADCLNSYFRMKNGERVFESYIDQKWSQIMAGVCRDTPKDALLADAWDHERWTPLTALLTRDFVMDTFEEPMSEPKLGGYYFTIFGMPRP